MKSLPEAMRMFTAKALAKDVVVVNDTGLDCIGVESFTNEGGGRMCLSHGVLGTVVLHKYELSVCRRIWAVYNVRR